MPPSGDLSQLSILRKKGPLTVTYPASWSLTTNDLHRGLSAHASSSQQRQLSVLWENTLVFFVFKSIFVDLVESGSVYAVPFPTPVGLSTPSRFPTHSTRGPCRENPFLAA
ncbi:leptin receptor [Platysternon megacephalum]|uniref:Leptin receptor n=1 Tax=Platysternon megacephalum TaxID=55544 RepID=A0A4D9ENV4_9SAUR|nr:leptin receptor [Platysternon megacephalum]